MISINCNSLTFISLQFQLQLWYCRKNVGKYREYTSLFKNNILFKFFNGFFYDDDALWGGRHFKSLQTIV